MWLVLGYGNALHADDGFGIAVAERLLPRVDPEMVEVVTAHQLTPEWAEPISRADGVIFVDASVALSPGQIQCLDLAEAASAQPARNAAFTHQCTPDLLLHAARVLYGRAPRAWLYTVGGAGFALGETLSAAVEAAVDRVIELILDRLYANCSAI
jgi:hydrogenase maturation protease